MVVAVRVAVVAVAARPGDRCSGSAGSGWHHRGPGGTTSGGWTKIFFAANGVVPSTTLINVNNLNFQDSCDGTDHDPEFRNDFDNSMIRAIEIDYDTAPATVTRSTTRTTISTSARRSTRTTPTATTPGTGSTTTILMDVIYANTVGTMVKLNVTLSDDADDELFNSTDCAMIGAYVAL